MSVAIRLQRQGATKKPLYKVVVLDKEKKRDGAFLEIIGDYHPKAEEANKKIFINKDRYDFWVGKGAQVSETVSRLLKSVK